MLRQTISLLTISGFCNVALAQSTSPLAELDYQIGYRGTYDSNALLIDGNNESEITNRLFVDLALNRVSTRFDFSLDGTVSYLTYVDSLFASEWNSDLGASALWRISPERFHWVIENDLARAPLDTRGPRTIANQQQTNRFSTGPDLLFQISPADRVVLGARYNDFYTEESEADRNTLSASVDWSRELTTTTSFGARVQASAREFGTVELDPTQTRDFDQYDASLRYSASRPTGSNVGNDYTIEAGYSTVRFDEPGREDVDSPLFRVSWNQTRVQGLNLSASVAVEIGNAATAVGNLPDARGAVVAQANAAVADPFKRRSLSGGLGREFGRWGLGVRGSLSELDYDQANRLDEENWRLGADLSYGLSPLMRIGIGVGFERAEFVESDQEDDFVNASFSWSYQRTPRWSYAASAGWSDRDSTVGQLTADNFTADFEIVFRR